MIESIDVPYAAIRRQLSASVDFATVTRRLEEQLGVMDLGALDAVAARRDGEAGLRARLQSMAGPSGFAVFQKIDHGVILDVLASRPARAITYVFGNALIAMEMTRHAPEVGLYVPPRLFVIEPRAGTTAISYDVPSAAFAQFGDAVVMVVARGLDAKIEALVRTALGG